MEQGNLADSLAKAQASIGGAKATKENKFLKNKYADLSSVYEACRDALSENGIAVVQVFETLEDGTLFLRSSLMKGAERIDSRLPLQWIKDWHSMGSAITYARRYSLSALVGVCPEDDDGSQAMGMTSTKSSQSLPRRSPLVTLQERAYSIITQIPHATEFIRSISKGDINVAKLAEPLAKRVTGYGKEGMKDKVEEWLKKNQKEEVA